MTEVAPTTPRICLSRCVVYDELSWYYAVGNTPPIYLFPGKTPGQRADILCLACGDLRSPLYSLWLEFRNSLPKASESVHFVLNDADPCILARNLLILDLALAGEGPETLLAIWCSLFLESSQHEALQKAIARVLAHGHAGSLKKSLGATFQSEDDWKAIEAVLLQWQAWHLTKARVLELRETFAQRMKKLGKMTSGSFEDFGKGHAHVAFLKHKMQSTVFPQESAVKEVLAYFKTGALQTSGGPLDYVNHTLLRCEDAFDLHYGTNPFLAFPLFGPRSQYGAPQSASLMQCCLSQLGDWCAVLRQFKAVVSWTLAVGDCLAICAELPKQTFHVVSTSNVADHVGLLPLLLAARPVIASDGVLLTSTLLHLNYSADTSEYLTQNLMVKPELWPSWYGWRCMGYEGSLAPVSSEVQFESPDVEALVLQRLDAGSTSRSEANFAWVPTPPPSTPLALWSCKEFCKALDACQPSSHLFSSLMQPKAVAAGLHLRHGLSFLPLLLRASSSDAEGDFKTRVGQEVADLMRSIRGEVPWDIVVATLPYPWAEIAAQRQNPLCLIEQQPTLRVELQGKVASHPYSGVWTSKGPNQPTAWVHWLVSERRLAETLVVRLHGLFTCMKQWDVAAITCQNVEQECLMHWADSARAGLCAVGCRQVEDEAECRVELDTLPGTWWESLDQGGKLDVAAVHRDPCSLHVGTKLRGGDVGSALELRFACPVDAGTVRLLLSRKRRSLTIVAKKKAFDFLSRLRAEQWIQDEVAWYKSSASREFMVTVSGLQMSQAEKYISRSRNGCDVPPLIALKDSLMFFFQVPEDRLFHLAVLEEGQTDNIGTPNVCGLVLHHGLRQEHRTGLPAADISLCFLDESILNEVLSHWFELLESHGKRDSMRNIIMTPAEFELRKQLSKLLVLRRKWDVPHPELPAALRPHFERILVQPLFAHQSVIAKEMGSFTKACLESQKTESDSLARDKEKGVGLIAQGKFQDAIGCFRSGINAFRNRNQSKQRPEQLGLAVACYLNIAHSELKLAERAPLPSQRQAHAKEVLCSCDCAVELLKEVQATGPSGSVAGQGALAAQLTKVAYRKGLALEILGDLEGARRLLQEASKGESTDKQGSIAAALARVSSLAAEPKSSSN
ncbi:unnamed protein product [Polarella glacialis]|uniref:DUF4470 domain-containing protein n=1 Tax=Polarella glacialis TaxID=89957 RepID=A0A813HKV8_POLGL|nr:unnamed protein product [Polarella glacialis]